MESEIGPPVVVVTGVGGIGAATARHLGNGRLLVLADNSPSSLESTASQLRMDGHKVQTFDVDVTNHASVIKLANDAAALGRINAVVHTAGVSPPKASAKSIYEVNMLGTAHVIDAFQPVMLPGSSMVCISSSAHHFERSLSAEDEKHFCVASLDQLLRTAAADLASDDNGKAYRVSKRANVLRVQAASSAYGARGARINIISPGIIATSMGDDVLAGPNGDRVRGMIAASPIPRIGTPDDVAQAVAFLAGPTASYITATELLIDGGGSASILRPQQPQK